ncbi:MAG: S41 family peptidase [Candidatus Peribacteraceae bacterium]|nr:S41 family peptidase [Candidatus Peribacteraceae bacterium]MDD5742800.1 S41 family peptidase [Candidatus Peribacteraceae bacterium]
MKRAFRIGIVVLLPLITLSLGWGLGMRYARQQVADTMSQLEFLYQGKTASGTLVHDPEKEVNLALLWGVWRLLQQHYIAPEKLETTNMLFGATAGLVRALDDPYTTFMTPHENTDFKEGLGGKLHGIGAELTMKDGSIVVVAPLKGSPAQEAGLLPEDIILKVDGNDISNETLTNVVQRIRGPKGSTVKLEILRKSQTEPMELTIKRDDITIPSVESEVKKTESGSIGVIALNQFGDETIREVETALRDFQREQEPVRGIVIDLRFNGGGYLDGAVELASLFVKQGKVVTVQRREGEPVSHYVNGRPLDPDLPLAVIINAGSASASEIFAGAIQDHKRGIIVGKTSFGKGTVQEVFDLPGGSSLRVTVARWLTPGGKDLSKEGIHPDIEVDRTPEETASKLDPQLDAAVQWLFSHEEPGVPVVKPAVQPPLKQKVGKEIDTVQ